MPKPLLLKAAPDAITPEYLRALLAARGVTQAAAAGLLRVSPVTMRRWLMAPGVVSARPCPWMAGELLRRLTAEQA